MSEAEFLKLMKPYLGAPYRWTVDGSPADGPGAPFWYQEQVPTPEEVHKKGCCCVGLLNIVLGLMGSPLRFAGTSFVWAAFKAAAKPVTGIPPPLSILMADYRGVDSQGHVGIVLEGGRFLHCYVDDPEPKEGLFFPGITIDDSWQESDVWARYQGWV